MQASIISTNNARVTQYATLIEAERIAATFSNDPDFKAVVKPYFKGYAVWVVDRVDGTAHVL